MSKQRNGNEGRVLPSDLASEAALLGAIINHATQVLFEIRALLDHGQVFYGPEHEVLYNAILEVFDAGDVIRPLTIAQQLKRTGKDYILSVLSLSDIQNEGINCNVLNTALYLRELYIKRLSIQESKEVWMAAFEGQPLDVVSDKAKKLAETIAVKQNIAVQKDLSHYVKSALTGIDEASKSSGLVGLNTGSYKINKVTGGFRRKKLYIIAARPGVGKTAVALHHAKSAAADGRPVGIVSLEMPHEELIERLLSSECGIPYESLGKGHHENGDPLSVEERKRIEVAAGVIERMPLELYDGGSFDVNDICYWVLDLVRRKGLAGVIIDYIQLMEDRLSEAKTYERVSAVSRKLKKLADNGNIPVIALSQLNRALENRPNRRPEQSDLRESGQLEQDADGIILLYRDDAYKLKDAIKAAVDGKVTIPPYDNILEYDVAKLRGGRPRLIKLYINIGLNIIADDHPKTEVAEEPKLNQIRYGSNFPADAAARSFAEPMHEQFKPIDDTETPPPF